MDRKVPLGELARYWWALFVVGVRVFIEFVREHVVVSFGSFVLGALLAYHFVGIDEVIEEVWLTALFLFAPLGLIAFVTGLYGILAEPWRRETALKQQNQVLAALVVRKVHNQEAARDLSRVYDRGAQLMCLELPDEIAFPSWLEDIKAWKADLYRVMARWATPSELVLMRHVSVEHVKQYPYKVSAEHNKELNYMRIRLERLERVIRAFDSDS